MADGPIRWRPCCVFTACSIGTTPKAGNGRRPYPLETMLRIHCMQHWYNLSDG
ncbi:transposase, partial [Klebsiella pneumoniae]|uniref:transposase n=1 Tax=Klebsiella pneumoniae TaxID=573 RepID=UPI00333F2EB8